MKTIDELGISKAQWSVNLKHPGYVLDADDEVVVKQLRGMDARLIAAAPELYKALFNIVDSYNRCEPMDVLPNLIERAEEALAKASGEEVK